MKGLIMTRSAAIFVLLLAATLEAGGDAILRAGLHTQGLLLRYCLFALAAIVLFAYGWTVNTPHWDFGKLIGLYVVFFFVIAQLISWLIFRQPPSVPVMLGGILIISGGVLISFAQA
jgi:small multidrug resistance family-3 protein